MSFDGQLIGRREIGKGESAIILKIHNESLNVDMVLPAEIRNNQLDFAALLVVALAHKLKDEQFVNQLIQFIDGEIDEPATNAKQS